MKKSIFSKLFILLLLLLMFNLITLSIGDEESSITVVNKTLHYLHIMIGGTPFTYIAPDKAVTKTSKPVSEMQVYALYSPGQGIKGTVAIMAPVPYQGASQGCTCTDGDPECSYTPPVGGSARLEITPEMLANGTSRAAMAIPATTSST